MIAMGTITMDMTTTAIRTITDTIMARERPLVRSSPRKRGPRLDSRLRGNERGKAAHLETTALYRLMIWLSPAYPVGAFSYSSGIEWAVEAGDITSAATLRGWMESMLSLGAGLSDGIFFAQTHRAVAGGDHAGLVELAELAAAFVPSRERHLETTTLGRAFVEVTQAAWPCDALAKFREVWGGPIAYPVAVGVACAGHDIPLAPALHAFLTAVASNWISAGVRLVPLGHTDSQRLLQALEPAIAAAAQRALAAELDDLGSATFRADLAGIRHETQYTRLFRS
jgi:urease accessory protein